MSYEFVGDTVMPGTTAWCKDYPSSAGCAQVQASSKPTGVSGKDILSAGVDVFKSIFGGRKSEPAVAPSPVVVPQQSAGLFGISTNTLLIVGVGIAAFMYLRKRK